MNDNNVIRFPLYTRNIPKLEEEVLKGHQITLAEEVIMNVMGHIVQILRHEGYDVASDELFPNALLLEDAIRASVYASIEEEHPLHDLAEEYYSNFGEDGIEIEAPDE